MVLVVKGIGYCFETILKLACFLELRPSLDGPGHTKTRCGPGAERASSGRGPHYLAVFSLAVRTLTCWLVSLVFVVSKGQKV